MIKEIKRCKVSCDATGCDESVTTDMYVNFFDGKFRYEPVSKYLEWNFIEENVWFDTLNHVVSYQKQYCPEHKEEYEEELAKIKNTQAKNDRSFQRRWKEENEKFFGPR